MLLGLCMMVVVTGGYPCISLIARHHIASLIACSALIAAQSCALNLTVSSGLVMINQASTQPHVKEQVGSINGASHMVVAATRVIGPSAAGALWSVVTGSHIPGGAFVPFFLCMLCTFGVMKTYQMV